MLNLIKYELQKQKISKLVILAIFLVLELIFAFGLIRKDMDISGVMAVFMLMTAIFSIIYVSLEAIITYNKDMKQKSGYMLFMVPYSEYTILGAKILTNIITLVVMTACILALGFADMTIMGARFGGAKEMYELFQLMAQRMYGIDVNYQYLVMRIIISVIGWIGVITSAFLAITIVHTVLKQMKAKGLITFVIFIAINIAYSYVCDKVFTATAMASSLILSTITSAVFVVICFGISGYMLHRKLSL